MSEPVAIPADEVVDVQNVDAESSGEVADEVVSREEYQVMVLHRWDMIETALHRFKTAVHNNLLELDRVESRREFAVQHNLMQGAFYDTMNVLYLLNAGLTTLNPESAPASSQRHDSRDSQIIRPATIIGTDGRALSADQS